MEVPVLQALRTQLSALPSHVLSSLLPALAASLLLHSIFQNGNERAYFPKQFRTSENAGYRAECLGDKTWAAPFPAYLCLPSQPPPCPRGSERLYEDQSRNTAGNFTLSSAPTSGRKQKSWLSSQGMEITNQGSRPRFPPFHHMWVPTPSLSLYNHLALPWAWTFLLFQK